MIQDDTQKSQTQSSGSQDDTIVHFDLSGDTDLGTDSDSPSLTVNLNEEENIEEDAIVPLADASVNSDMDFTPSPVQHPMMSGSTPFSLMGDTTDIESILDTLDNAVEELKAKRVETKQQHEENIRAKENEIEREKEKMESDDKNYEERIIAVTQRLEGIRGKLPATKNNVVPFKSKEKKDG